MADFQHFHVRWRGDVLVIFLRDLGDKASLVAGRLGEDLSYIVDLHRPKKVVMDFVSITYCPSSMINDVLRMQQMMPVGSQLKCCGMNEWTREKFRVLNLEGTVVEICDAEQEALATF